MLLAWSMLGSNARADDPVPFEVVAEIRGNEDAHVRIGDFQRMFIIDNQWDLRRYSMLIPDLPQIDTSQDLLVVVVSWPLRSRSFTAACIQDGTTLAIEIGEAPPPQVADGMYRPPTFLIAQTHAWSGPISFSVNGKHHHTILRGEVLARQSRELWQEIERVHKGGEPTRERALRYWRHSHFRDSNLSDDEILLKTAEYGIADREAYFEFAFNELARIGPAPILPELIAFAERMEQHDPAQSGLANTLIALGGQPVVDSCKRLLQSENVYARRLGIGVLITFGFPEFRPIAIAALFDTDESVIRGALELLNRIGLNETDVDYLLDVIELAEERDFKTYSIVTSILYDLGELGAKAQGAIGTLQRLTSADNKLVARYATEALEKIEADSERVSKALK